LIGGRYESVSKSDPCGQVLQSALKSRCLDAGVCRYLWQTWKI